MAYGSYLVLDQTRAFRGDFSSDAFLTGTIYSDKNLTTAKDLTGYTLTIRMNRSKHMGDWFGKTATIVSAANGTWSYLVGEGELPTPGVYFVKIELTKSGVRESTLNRVELHILAGPSG